MDKIRDAGRWFLGLVFCLVFGLGNVRADAGVSLRDSLSLNGTWKTVASSKDLVVKNLEKELVEGWYLPEYDDSSWQEVNIPADCLKEVREHRAIRVKGIRWFRKRFILPGSLKGKRIILEVGKLRYVSWLWVNGQPVYGKYEVDDKYPGAAYQGVLMGPKYDITDHLRFDSENLIAIYRVNNRFSKCC